jgi:hypothetical protein
MSEDDGEIDVIGALSHVFGKENVIVWDSSSGLNPDGVPMNETDAGNLWKSWLEKEGNLVVKVENIGLSLPDYFWVYKGLVIFNEAKIRRGNLVYAPVYQFINMRKMSLYLHDWALSYVVYNNDQFELYSFKDIVKDKSSWIDGTLTGGVVGKMKIDLKNREPFLIIPNADAITLYIEWVHNKAFKKKQVQSS